MEECRVVLDTNVLRAAVWSANGASNRLVRLVGERRLTPLLSVPLYLEYREILLSPDRLPPDVSADRMIGFLRRFAGFCEHREIYFLWRPWLSDADDDMILELAVSGRATHIVTFNIRDFAGVDGAFGIQVVTPGHFLRVSQTES